MSCYLTSSSSYLSINTTAKSVGQPYYVDMVVEGRLSKSGRRLSFPARCWTLKENCCSSSANGRVLILILHRLDIFERTMVGVYRDHRSSKIHRECADGSNESQRFFLDCGVVEFRWLELGAEVADRMFQSINDLNQYCSQTVIWSINNHTEWNVIIGWFEYRRDASLDFKSKTAASAASDH